MDAGSGGDGKGLRVNVVEEVALQGAGTLSLQTEDKAN